MRHVGAHGRIQRIVGVEFPSDDRHVDADRTQAVEPLPEP